MFMGPLEAVKPWSMKGVEGVYRFLGRAWRMIVDAEADVVRLDPRVKPVDLSAEQAKVVARTVAAVTDDFEALRFNTAISRLMEFVNFFTGAGSPAASRRWRPSPSCSRRWRPTWPRSSGSSWATNRPWPTSPGPNSTPRS